MTKERILARVDRAKRLLPIDRLLSAYGVKQRPGAIRCPLPGHNDSKPSFGTYDNGRKWKCFGCGRGGDVIDLIKGLDNCGFERALEVAEGLIGAGAE